MIDSNIDPWLLLVISVWGCFGILFRFRLQGKPQNV